MFSYIQPSLLLFLTLCHIVELIKVKTNDGWLEGEIRNLSTGLGTVCSFKGIPFAEPPVGKLRFKCQVVALIKIKTNDGWLEGEIRNLSTGLGSVYSFKGIPYAEPPVGKLRFKDPVPHKGWDGIRPAIKHGAVCLQYDVVWAPLTKGSDDCLFLNVYTPTISPSEPLPVIISINEGGWKWGSGNDDQHGPDFLVAFDVILVTFNYRLGALGQLTLDTKEVPGNAGMKDQVLVMKWVQSNIKYFGGDPERVTILGESSAGASVIYHLMSPMTKGLFKRAISMSGNPLADFAIPFHQTERSFILGKSLGSTTNDPGKLLRFLQGISGHILVTHKPVVVYQEDLWEFNAFKIAFFVPVVEKDFGQERFLIETPKESLINGNIHDVEFMIGYTDREHQLLVGAQMFLPMLKKYNMYKELLVPREILYEVSPEKVLELGKEIHQHYFGDKDISLKTMPKFIDHADEHHYIYSTHRFMNYLPKRKSNIYFYKFFTVSKRNRYSEFASLYGVKGCSHTDDLRYIYDFKTDPFPVNIHSREYRLINQTCSLFTNFAKYGNPTPDSSLGVQWPPFDNQTRPYLKIDETLTTDTNPDAEAVSWWRGIFEKSGMTMP